MENISKILTSELIFSCIYPESRKIDSSKDIEKEVYNRLIRGFHFDLDSAHKFFDQEAAIIQERGDNLENYYFNCYKKLDEYLEAFLSSFRDFSRLLSYKDNMNSFTFSELVMFRIILENMVYAYKKEKKQFEKNIRGYSRLMNRVTRSNMPITEIDIKYAELKSFKEKLENSLGIQGQYSHFWDYLSNVIFSKVGLLMNCSEDKLRVELNFIRELSHIGSVEKTQLGIDLKQYKQVNFGRVGHDQKILSRYDVSAFIKD